MVFAKSIWYQLFCIFQCLQGMLFQSFLLSPFFRLSPTRTSLMMVKYAIELFHDHYKDFLSSLASWLWSKPCHLNVRWYIYPRSQDYFMNRKCWWQHSNKASRLKHWEPVNQCSTLCQWRFTCLWKIWLRRLSTGIDGPCRNECQDSSENDLVNVSV